MPEPVRGKLQSTQAAEGTLLAQAPFPPPFAFSEKHGCGCVFLGSCGSGCLSPGGAAPAAAPA